MGVRREYMFQTSELEAKPVKRMFG